ncbi:hypothetical protein AB0L74_00715 [Streptomyces sp. NPDC052020]|uniref:hypothetical protein n=1 Tax=Streptomyces sp. NPDC052020 TaxID=3155677 RepID=UPI00341628F1
MFLLVAGRGGERYEDGGLDEATRYVVDNKETFGLSYPTARGRDIVGRFVSHSRAVVLSERRIEEKAERLTALAGPVQNIFFTRHWRVPIISRSFEEFDRAVTALDEDLPADHVAPVLPPGASLT